MKSADDRNDYKKISDDYERTRTKRKVVISKKQFVLISLTTMTVLAAIAVAVAITLYCFGHKKHSHGVLRSPDAAELYQHGAVAADSVTCSEVGRDILIRNGSAVDAAIAALFCLGVFSMHSTGIGGGGCMLVYKKDGNSIEAFDYKSTAPGKAREDMFMGEGNRSSIGGLAIAVPGEIRGMYEVWKKYGKLPWHDLVQPAINITTEGFQVPQRMHETAHIFRSAVESDPGLRSLLFKNGKIVELGTIVKDPTMAATLKRIQQNPEDFYTGALAEDIVKDIQDVGGIITLDDLANYKVVKRKVLVDEIGDLTMYTVPAPMGGPVVTQILNIVKGYGFSQDDLKDNNKAILLYHRLIEAMKFSFAQYSKLGDPDFVDEEAIQKLMDDMTSAKVGHTFRQKITDDKTHELSYYGAEAAPPFDKGTSHVSVFAANGDAVAATHTINSLYGAAYKSKTTGILYNSVMDDFSTQGGQNKYGFPPSQMNYIKPGKRPMSSMAPFILVDKYGRVKMVLGCSGGPRIITASVSVLMHKLWFGEELGHAVTKARAHHQLIPNTVWVERRRELPKFIRQGLMKKGHNITQIERPEFSACQVVYSDGPGEIFAKSDPRKYGHSAGY
eukprot:gene14206-15688_t